MNKVRTYCGVSKELAVAAVTVVAAILLLVGRRCRRGAFLLAAIVHVVMLSSVARLTPRVVAGISPGMVI